MGIEPTWPAWKAGALPLSYTRALAEILAAAGALSTYLPSYKYHWRLSQQYIAASGLGIPGIHPLR